MESTTGVKDTPFVSSQSASGADAKVNQLPNPVSDSISLGNEQSYFEMGYEAVAGVLGWIKDRVVSIFRAIFCCDCAGLVGIKSKAAMEAELADLTEFKASIEALRQGFLNHRSEESFQGEWQAQLEAQPEIKDRIIKEDLKAVLRSKEGALEGDALKKAVASRFKIEQHRKDAEDFVVGLNPIRDSKNKVHNPKDNAYVPSYLQIIIKDTDDQIKELEEALKK